MRDIDVVLLNDHEDGIAQISDVLDGESDISAIHIISHGADGTIQLGNSTLDFDSLITNAAQIKRWGNALSDDADVLIYGCDVATSQQGQALIDSIGRLTGADVAASDDLTGSSERGGDWALEYRVGHIETLVALSAEVRSNWYSTLTTYTVTNTNNSGAGSLRAAIISANGNAGVDTIAFNIATTDANHLYYRDNGAAGFSTPVTTTLADAAITDFDADYPAGTARSWYRISLSGSDLGVTEGVIIDGSTQPGYNSAKGPVIELNAAGVSSGDPNALTLTTGASTVRGLVINNAGDNAIEVDSGAGGSTIVGNFLGTDVSGTQARGNSTGGSWGAIAIKSNNVVVGGTTAADRNLISGNSGSGIEIYNAATGALIRGNYIGTTVTGTAALGNVTAGIDIRSNAANNTVGGITAGMGNVIAFNGGDGISITSTASGNAMRGNSIYSNIGLGIDLNDDGVTANDTNDTDAGPNALKNFPIVTLVKTSGSTVTVSGTLHTTASAAHTIDFYASASADTTGYGEGATYLGATTVTTDGSGDASFSNVSFAQTVPVGYFISAVTVDLASGNTSEFSHGAVAVSSTQATITVDTTSDTSDGDTTSLSTLLANKGADGFISLREAIIAANNTANGAGEADRIYFNIAGAGTRTINVTSALPTITQALTIDGYSQSGTTQNTLAVGSNAVLRIEINGAGAGSANGLTLGAGSDGSVIQGLVINRFSGGILTNGPGVGIVVLSSGNTIAGNFIGVNAGGAAALGNSNDGIRVDGGDNNLIGGAAPGARNLISGNYDGVQLQNDADGNRIQGNIIGSDASATLDLGNNDNGIDIQSGSDNNLVGGTAAGEGNLIFGNNGVDEPGAINLNASSGADPVGVRILGNSIYNNGGVGIDLVGTVGVDTNDGGDFDNGPNSQQNFPLLTSAEANAAGTTIVGTLNSTANTSYRIEFFANRPTIADATNGEGERYLGFITVTTGVGGSASVGTTLANVWVNSGDKITATATNLTTNNTSEFAANVTASSIGIVVVDTTSDSYDSVVTSGTVTISGLGISRGGDNRISLREAIYATNNTANVGGTPDKIVFAIPAALSGGVHTINVGATALPTISQALIIDGTSEPDFAGTPVIELSGNGAAGVKGLELIAGSSGSTIKGLIVNRFGGTGIEIQNSNNHVIQGNWIGLDATGNAAAGNGNKGIYALNSTGLLIGGTTVAARNVVSGNVQQGIYFNNADNSTISGNYVGTNAVGTGDVTGTAPSVPQSGVFLAAGSTGNVIGGTTVAARNVLSGNNHYGLELVGSTVQNNVVQGNYIGTDATGMVALGNTNGGAAFWGAGTGNVFGGGDCRRAQRHFRQLARRAGGQRIERRHDPGQLHRRRG